MKIIFKSIFVALLFLFSILKSDGQASNKFLLGYFTNFHVKNGLSVDYERAIGKNLNLTYSFQRSWNRQQNQPNQTNSTLITYNDLEKLTELFYTTPKNTTGIDIGLKKYFLPNENQIFYYHSALALFFNTSNESTRTEYSLVKVEGGSYSGSGFGFDFSGILSSNKPYKHTYSVQRSNEITDHSKKLIIKQGIGFALNYNHFIIDNSICFNIDPIELFNNERKLKTSKYPYAINPQLSTKIGFQF